MCKGLNSELTNSEMRQSEVQLNSLVSLIKKYTKIILINVNEKRHNQWKTLNLQ